MHGVVTAALAASKAALAPGRPLGAVFDAHARLLDSAGHRVHRRNATGYGMGAVLAPNRMDWPMLHHGDAEPAAPGQVHFVHPILFDDEAGLAMTGGETALVTETGCESLSRYGIELVIG